MKSKKGFTLIELLAIIVILAIIAVITVPIILNVIDNSKKGAAIDSAYGYRDAIHKGFLTGFALDNDEVLPSGVYIIDSTGKLVNGNGDVLSAVVSGTVPTEGWVQLDKGNVIAYSLKFDDYVVTKYQDTDADAVKNGEIAENSEAREARLESERQTSAIEMAKGIALSQSGETEIIDITDGWVAFINGEVKAYSIKVTEGDYTYVVTDLDVDSNNSHAVADRTTSDLASKTSEEQVIVSYKVDTYVKAALTANSSLDQEDAKTVADLGDLTNKADSGWIHFNKVDNNVVVVDYSLTYGTLTANYSSLTDGNYVSTFSSARNKPAIIAVGTTVCFGPDESQECFRVIKNFTENGVEKAMLFANYNLEKTIDNTTNPETVTYRQNSVSSSNTCFSDNSSNKNYWHDLTTSALKSNYGTDINGNAASYSGNPYPYIYDSNSLTYEYVEGYLTTLKTAQYGLPSTATGRLLVYEEAVDTSMFANNEARRNGFFYWLGSAVCDYCVAIVDKYGNLRNPSDGSYIYNYGVRPVIVVSISDIPS